VSVFSNIHAISMYGFELPAGLCYAEFVLPGTSIKQQYTQVSNSNTVQPYFKLLSMLTLCVHANCQRFVRLHKDEVSLPTLQLFISSQHEREPALDAAVIPHKESTQVPSAVSFSEPAHPCMLSLQHFSVLFNYYSCNIMQGMQTLNLLSYTALKRTALHGFMSQAGVAHPDQCIMRKRLPLQFGEAAQAQTGDHSRLRNAVF